MLDPAETPWRLFWLVVTAAWPRSLLRLHVSFLHDAFNLIPVDY